MEIAAYCTDLARRASAAARVLATVRGELKNRWLLQAADSLEKRAEAILEANGRDVAAAKTLDLNAAQVDRLRLTPARIRAIIRNCHIAH